MFKRVSARMDRCSDKGLVAGTLLSALLMEHAYLGRDAWIEALSAIRELIEQQDGEAIH